jgi:hypothetical protein
VEEEDLIRDLLQEEQDHLEDLGVEVDLMNQILVLLQLVLKDMGLLI